MKIAGRYSTKLIAIPARISLICPDSTEWKRNENIDEFFASILYLTQDNVFQIALMDVEQ